jgi:photosystem II stability/assembly factor-like uncharacterized protein
LNRISGKRRWLIAPAAVIAIAGAVVGTQVQPSHSAMPAKQAALLNLKAELRKGTADADAVQRPQANREGSPSSADEQYSQERAFPASDVPASGYTQGFSQYSLLNQAGGGSYGWKELGPLSTANGSTWGPAAASTISGRGTAIAVDPSSCSGGTCRTIYLGTANGGIWKTTTAGHNWVEVMDHQSTEAIGSLALDPHNSNIIYAGTGEPNNAVDTNRGAGILKSTNGGRTWVTLGFNTFVNRSVADIVVDPTNGNIYAVSYIGRSGGSGTNYGSGLNNPYLPPMGFYRSTDGGNTWTLSNPTSSLFVDGTGRSGAVSLVRSSNGTLYLGVYGQGIYSSTDGGQTWNVLTNSSEMQGQFDRVTLAVAPSNPNVIYAAYSHDIDAGANGNAGESFYKSTDGGSTWTALPNTPDACAGQCWYDMPVNVSPTDPNTVYIGGVFNYNGCKPDQNGNFPVDPDCTTVVAKSTDGGASWQDIGTDKAGVNVHPDDHAILATASGGLFTANDGGLYHSANYGASWESLNNGIGSLTFQSVAVNSAGDVFGGTQDNGTWMMTPSSTNGIHILGGDGGMTAPDPSNNNIVFDEYYGTQLQRYNVQTGSQTWMAGFWFDYFDFGGGQFYEPVSLGTQNPDGTSASNDVFSGTYRLWRSETGGGTDGNNDGDATNDSSDKTDFVPITGNVGNITTIAVNPTNPNNVAIGTSNGKIYVTNNALAPVQVANSCNPSTPATGADNMGGAVSYYCRYMTHYGLIDPNQSGTDVCTKPWTNPFDTSSFCTYVSGVNWTRVDTQSGTKVLPNRAVTALTYTADGNLYATLSGFDENTAGSPGHVFVSKDQGATWTNISGNLPDLPANSVVVSPKGHIFVAEDYGVFSSLDGGQTWNREDYTLANAPVYDLALSTDGKRLYAATHGRGIWSATAP